MAYRRSHATPTSSIFEIRPRTDKSLMMGHHFACSAVRVGKTVSYVLMAGFLIAGCFSTEAAAKTHKYNKRPPVSAAMEARAADIVINAASGQILHAENADEIRHPASLTKMMTLYLTFQALDAGKLNINQRLWISSKAASQSPTKLGVRAGQTIRVEDAILGLVTCSANDAAVVLAEQLGGSEENFARLMSRQARALGMASTHFENASGLPDPEQTTSAADMARLGYALIKHYPHYYTYFSTSSFSYAGAPYRNHNHLMARYDGMDGIKTGYINASGFNLVASAVHGQTRLIGVVFGGTSAVTRDKKMEDLLDSSFAKSTPSTGAPQLLSAGFSDNGPHYAGGTLGLPAKTPALFAPTREAENLERAPAPPPAPIAPTVAPIDQPPIITAVNTQPATEKTINDVAQPTKEEPTPPRITKSSKRIKSVRATQNTTKTPGTWSIQVGAYNSKKAGQKALTEIKRNLAATLKRPQTSLQKIAIEDRAVYRARFVNLDEKSARSACSSLLKSDHSCLVILPQ